MAGGGVCWSETTCAFDSHYCYKNVQDGYMENTVLESGPFKQDIKNNQLSHWSKIVLPSCTCDAFLGNLKKKKKQFF